AWFGVGGIGKSPSRLDFAKLDNLNAHYIREAPIERLGELLAPHMLRLLGRSLTPSEEQRLAAALPDLKQRAKTLVELAENSSFYFSDGPPAPDEKAKKLLTADAGLLLARLHQRLLEVPNWNNESLGAVLRAFADAEQIKLGQIAQPLRAALTGRAVSPGVFDVMRVLGREETLGRIKATAMIDTPILGNL
ncbi:MAG: glutamate--tRNA ligase, partial [Alphaproteobacteria bacterium]|nr:glutamate--tRNA ligase [Alphaproteobacteria bacterium]